MGDEYLKEAENIRRVIDFANHNYPEMSAEVTSTYDCDHCGHLFPDGELSYNHTGFNYNPETLDLSVERIKLPLKYLHIAGFDGRVFSQKSIIQKFFDKSNSWDVYFIPEHSIDLYVDVMKINVRAEAAARVTLDFLECAHAPIYFSEDEMKSDPEKRELIEHQEKIMSGFENVIESASSEIDSLVRNILGERELPKQYSSEVSGLEEPFLSLKLSFIRDTYDTFKAGNIFFPDKKTTDAINKIENYQK